MFVNFTISERRVKVRQEKEQMIQSLKETWRHIESCTLVSRKHFLP